MKKFAILFSIFILLIIATVTLLFFYIRTDHAKNLLTSRINRAIPGRVQAESWDINFFPLSIRLSGIEVESSDKKKCGTVESVETIIDLSSLFDRTIEIRSLTIRKPRINLERDEQGYINIVNAFVSPEAQKGPGKEKPDSKRFPMMNILVEKAEVNQGNLVFRDPAGRMHLPDVRIRLSRFNLEEKSFSLSFETKSGSGTIRGENIAVPNAKITAAFDPKAGADLEAAIQSDLFTLKTSGKVSSFTRNPKVEIDLHAESRLGVISRFTESYTGPKGDVILSLTGSGTLNNPDVEFEVKMPELSGPGAAKAEAVNMNASLSEQVLTIERANLDLLGTTVRAEGRIDFSNSFSRGFLESDVDLNKTEYDLSFSQKGMDLKVLKPWIKGLSGRFSAKGSVSGKGIHPDTLDGEYHLQLAAENFKPAGPGKPVSHAKVSAGGRIKDHILTVTELTARTPDAETRISGQVDIRKQQCRGTLTAESRNLLSALSVAGIRMLDGSVEARVDFSGDLFNPSLDARIHAENLSVDENSIERLELDASLLPSGKALIRKLEVTKDPSSVLLTGEADIFKNGFRLNESIDADFTVTGNNLVPVRILDWTDIEMETQFLPSRVDFELAGRLFCDLSDFPDKSGSAAKTIPVRAVHADLDIKEKSLSATFDKSTDLTADGDFKENRYRASLQFRKTPVAPFFQAVGIAGWKGNVTGRIKASGEIPIAVPPDAGKIMESAGGHLNLDAELDGTLDRPDLHAALTIRQGSSPVPGTEMALSEVTGAIKATPEKITIKKLTGKLDSGNFSVAGTMGLENLVPRTADIALEGERIMVQVPDTAMVRFDTDLTYSLTPESSHLSGKVEILEGEYTRDFNVNPIDAITRKTRTSPALPEKSSDSASILNDTVLDVRINARTPFVVDNNMILASIDPDFSITGTPARPIPLGRIIITEGTVTYFKREFEIEKGNVRFTDPYAVDPEIELTAVHRIRDWTIQLAVSGKSDNLDFHLTSDPKESHRDIVSLLVTGKTARELAEGEGKSNSPTSFVTDKASGIINKGITESTPLDSFEMNYDEDGENGAKVDVTMGKELSRRLSVKYQTETENQQTVHTGEAEYKLLENLMLKTFNDSEGNFGGEMKFKLEFR